MNQKNFFDAIRPAFGGKLNSDQVIGMSALLDAGAGLPLHHMANVLAQVRRETGGIMAPIKETVMASHRDKNPSDAEVIRRLDRAYARGKLPWVKAPYWREGYFGRGQIGLTHPENYARFGIVHKDDALIPHISAHVAVRGMRDGLFRKRKNGTPIKLADFNFPAALDAAPDFNPRRIVNGQDGSDAEVALFHRQFAAALAVSGWGETPAAPQPAPDPALLAPTLVDDSAGHDPAAKDTTIPNGDPRSDWRAALITALLAFLKWLGGKK